MPAGVRKKLGVGPGAVLEWEERDGEVLVRRAGRFTSEDMHAAAFPKGKRPRRSVSDMDEGIRRSIRKRHARG